MLEKAKNYFPFFLALVAGILFIGLGTTGQRFTHYPGDLIDGRFNNYLLEHVFRFFTGKESSFWSAPYMFPEKNVITYSDNLLGTAPFYALFRFVGCEREQAFQCWYILLAALNFTGCYLLLNYLFKNSYAAAAGAMVFAFSLALQSQLGHAQTFPRFAIPLAFLFGLKFMESTRPSYFFWAVFLVVYEIYCGIYLGFMLAVSMGLFFIVSIFFQKSYFEKVKDIKWCGKIILCLGINGLILLPLMLPYLERAAQLGYYPYEQVSRSLLTPSCFFFSWWGTFFWKFLNDFSVNKFPNYADYQVFAGGFATLCLGVFVIAGALKFLAPRRSHGITLNEQMKALFVSGLLIFLIFLRLGDFSLYKIIYAVPGLGSLRALQRIINIELMFYAIGVAFCFKYFAGNLKYAPLIFTGCVGFFVLDNYVKPDCRHRHEVVESLDRVNPLIEKIRQTGSRKVLSYEPDTVDSSIMDFQLDAMLAAQSLGIRTLNGYSSTSPPGYNNYWSAPNEANRMAWMKSTGLEMDSVMVIK